MKKILSILVIAAMLLAALCVTASAGTYFDRNSAISYKDAKFQIKKSYIVKIDGVISEGEYEEFTGHCEWWIGEMASDAYQDAQKMAETVKWYFSWDGSKYFNVAAVFDAGVGAKQNHPGGDLFGDYNKKDADPNYVFDNADYFLGWGPGMQIISNEASAKTSDWARLCYAIGKSTVDGGYITGTYSDQNGQPSAPYSAVGGQDFEVAYNGSIVTIEWRIPVYQLNENFVEGVTATTNFKCSVTVASGLFNSELAAEMEGTQSAVYNYGVRLGMLGFNADSSLEDKGHATFVLTKNEIPAPDDDTTSGGGDDTTIGGGDDTTIGGGDDTTIGGGDDTTIGGGNDTTIGGGNDNTTAGGINDPAEKPDNNNGENNNNAVNNNNNATNNNATNKPNNNVNNNNNATNNNATNKPNNNVNASTTADPMIIAAVVSALSACGVMIAKKRK